MKNQVSGYVFNFNGHGSFAPDGKVPDMTPEQVTEHNKELARAEVESMRLNGRALLYFHKGNVVGTWDGTYRFSIHHQRDSITNWNCKRIDLWFRDPSDGATWHGVNIGDNDIVRCKRNK